MSAAENVICLADRRARVAAVADEKTTMQEGFIAIPNSVEDALLRAPITHRQERLYRAVLRKTVGYGKGSDFIATSQLAEMTGIDESDVRKTLIELVSMGMIARGRRTKFGTETTPNLASEAWDFEANKVNHPEQGKSPRLPPQTGRITPNKQGELPPTKDNYNKQTTTPVVPKAKTRASAGKKTFAVWSADEKAAGRPLVPEDDPVFTYAEQVGIHRDILRLAWQEFRTRYADAGKLYTDWRQTFRNAVRGNWFKLWYFDNGECLLTTAGIQAQKAAEAQA